MFIYTFWEPREKIPVYLQLCMETWKKFLPNATIVILDYENLSDLLDMKEIGANLFSGRFKIAQISDAIRVALLAKYGGVWLDIDTIILNSSAEKYFLPDENHQNVFFGELEDRGCHIAFINAPPSSVCMNLWRERNREIIWRTKFLPEEIPWDIFGNSFIDAYARKYPNEVRILDRRLVIPESESSLDSAVAEKAYLSYYFTQNLHVANIPADMLFLHNSWTPPEFKDFSLADFLRVDCTLTNVLTEILEIPVSSKRFRIAFTS